MIAKWKCILFNIICVAVTAHSYIIQDPSYSPDYIYTFDINNDLKPTFLDRRRQNSVTAKRVKLLDKYLSNNSVFVDGITHYKVNENHTDLKQVEAIENEFKNLIQMKGLTYVYKRGKYWRTWRKVQFPDGEKIVCYRCQSGANCSHCQNSGYWVIAEKPPPCPLEIVSVISNEEICAVNITNTTDINKPCPLVVQSSDLTRICDNPIETKWRVQKVYNKNASELFPAIICNGQDYCEISTFYMVTRKHISFRITNSTNHILYSRVMENGNQNYACVTNCGKIDPTTNTHSETDKPVLVDFFNKNKRDDKKQHDPTLLPVRWTRHPIFYPLKSKKLKEAINKMETVFNLPVSKNTRRENYPVFNLQVSKDHHHENHVKHPSCLSMKHLNSDESDNK